jgi:hypothetical protein
MPVLSQRASGTDCYKMEIAGLGLGMIVLSVALLVWAFPRIPNH